MSKASIRFDDGAGYERAMGIWSQLAGQVLLDWLAPSLGLRWVDVGCGNGAFTELLVRRCAPSERPSTRCVPVKTDDQLDLQALHRVRSRLVGQRTAVINQIRSFLLERGITVRQGLRFLRQQLLHILAKLWLNTGWMIWNLKRASSAMSILLAIAVNARRSCAHSKIGSPSSVVVQPCRLGRPCPMSADRSDLTRCHI